MQHFNPRPGLVPFPGSCHAWVGGVYTRGAPAQQEPLQTESRVWNLLPIPRFLSSGSLAPELVMTFCYNLLQSSPWEEVCLHYGQPFSFVPNSFPHLPPQAQDPEHYGFWFVIWWSSSGKKHFSPFGQFQRTGSLPQGCLNVASAPDAAPMPRWSATCLQWRYLQSPGICWLDWALTCAQQLSGASILYLRFDHWAWSHSAGRRPTWLCQFLLPRDLDAWAPPGSNDDDDGSNDDKGNYHCTYIASLFLMKKISNIYKNKERENSKELPGIQRPTSTITNSWPVLFALSYPLWWLIHLFTANPRCHDVSVVNNFSHFELILHIHMHI